MSEIAVKPGVGATILARVLTPFVDRPRTEQVVNVFVGPIAFGVICGLVLHASKPTYLLLQLVALAGGCSGGFEHRSARAGAIRGTFCGAMFGTYILAGYVLAGGHVGHDASPLLPLLNAVGGGILGAIFGSWRGRRDRRTQPV